VRRALRELDGKKRSRKPLFFREKLVIGLLVVLVILVAGLVVGLTMLNRTSRISATPVIHHRIEESVSESTARHCIRGCRGDGPGGGTAIAGTPILYSSRTASGAGCVASGGH
jgi:hypothetical protein